MESKYDCKFEEMKKYIPFLENMITRLESSSTPSSNPRQAQLDKIRSLRDLLSNKKKRMKMENLLKCEQVLINLYAKVEQRDKKTIDSGFSIDTPTAKEKSDLEAVRNKLKTVVKRQENLQDTLPEILPRSEVNDEHTSGTKEPALFQRRPHQQSGQTSKETDDSLTSPPNSSTKRNYTRVLVSPESSTRHARWSPSKTTAEKPLFSRRSPRKSPRRHSPSYYKKERKKSKDKQSRKQRDLNITLNVPEESLNSLNTKDILSRIIHCSDGDVDIDTLRELRKQILGELQKTGAKDDISDLILKSYNKSMDKTKTKKPTKKEEIEEGELSDSESEAIESIYGSLVVKEPGQTKTSLDKDTQPRKIQICLVINSDNKTEEKGIDLPKQGSTDFSELEMYEKEDKKEIKTNVEEDSSKANDDDKKTCETSKEDCDNSVSQKITEDQVISSAQDNIQPLKAYVCIPENNSASTTEKNTPLSNDECELSTVKEATQFKANFYKPLTEPSNLELSKLVKDKDTGCVQVGTDTDTKPTDVFDIESTLKEMETSPEIPLLHERTIDKQPPNSTLSEIDILQALKKEILSEITVPGTESTTPPLHQPKVMKVANAQANQILPKKRISIEKYKEKSVTSSQPHLNQVSYKEEQMKKTSLKLTDKECERFFNVPTIPFGEEEDESLDENDGDIQASDVYGDLAPKSPDNEDFSNANSAPPVIIPVDPIKNVPTISKGDVDMRALPLMSPKNKILNSTCTSSNNESSADKIKTDIKIDQGNSQNRPLLVDPRVRRDLNPNISTQSPNPHASNPERTPRQMFASISSNSTPNLIMTPNSRSYEMTPTHQSFEIDQSNRKHVYVPTMTSWDREKTVHKDIRPWENTDATGDRKSRIDDSRESCWNPQKDDISQNSRFNSDKYGNRYVPDMSVAPTQPYARKEAPMTPLPSFGRSDCPSTPSHPFGRLECPSTPSHPFGRLECPPTPSHPFGRYDCPPTPNHPFGRLECPPTPNHPFGRLECPPTPNQSFGRLECPSTPSHPFGRMDCPPTPSHSFGRSDCPSTPSHPFGRSEGIPPLMLGMSDCSKPPSNSFIGPDGPSTPTPLFGRNECTSSQTPKHSFGRSEPLKSQYGRSDFSTQNCTKDPRLNRKLDAESKSQYDERDRSYYKDQDRYRSSSYSSQKYSGSSNYRHYDRDLGANRNNKYKYFAPDQSGRQLNKEQERRDHFADRSISKDRESSAIYYRDRPYDADGRRYEEVGSRREYRDKSIGRSFRPDETQSSVRSPSVSKNNSVEPERNTLSVKSNTGRSFTIDTSINATFQKIIDSAKEMQGFDNSFDMRRQRAASVGRSLTRESSVGRVLSQPLNSYEKKKEVFQRASSVGRELVDSNKDKRSFQEIKADFKSSKFSGSQVCTDKKIESKNIHKHNINIEHSVNNRKDVYEKQRDGQCRSESVKPSYSPRMNYRDPRMRKLNKDKTDRSISDSSGRKSGIVYSNDNIVTGSIMASGYGVKNYKIPKIKRPIDENEDSSEKTDIISKNDNKEKRVAKNIDNITEKGCSKEKLHVNEQKGKVNSNDTLPHKVSGTAKDVSKKVNESIDTGVCIERRRTRSSIRSIETDTDVTGKVRKCKKVIYDSDSDDTSNENSASVIKNMNIERKDIDAEDLNQKHKDANIASEQNIGAKNIDADPERKDLKNEDVGFRDESIDSKNKKISEIYQDLTAGTEIMTTKDITSPKAKLTDHSSPVKAKINRDITSADLSSNFGIDELEMFSDNIVSDPVLDNITALIADLDNDLSSSRSDLGHNFTKEISLENMMQNISSPEKDNLMDNDDDSSKLLDEIDKISKDKVEVPNDNQIKSSSPMNHSLVSLGLETNMGLNKEDSAKNIKDKSCLKDTSGNLPTQSDALRNEKNNITKLPSLVMAINEDIDSTTEVSRNEKPVEDKSKLDEQNIDTCSTPDSTINTDDALLKSTNDESLPGSTNEVTSTELIETKPCSTKEIPPALDSIGSLLSILQDKSKIKELLLMLGDQSSDNEKIKKKLEKLSEIVSDDEESCDVPTSKLDQAGIDKVDFSEMPHVNVDKAETLDETEMESIDNETNGKDSNLSIDSNQNSSKVDDDVKTSDIEDEVQKTEVLNTETKSKKKPGKKTKYMKKGKGKAKKGATVAVKRITRATAADLKPKVKKPPRELMKLQEDIKEMFIRDDVLSATGIRMCRLAKLVDEKTSPTKEEQILPEVEPVVVLQKFKDTIDKNCDPEKIKKKKPGPKIKGFANSVPELATQDKMSTASKHKPGPKSKTKTKKDSDPYTFESDSFSDNITEKTSEAGSSSDTDSESDSLASSKSFGSTELLADIKKKTKRRRRGWQAGVIKTKTKKKKIEQKTSDILPTDTLEDFLPEKASTQDTNCFTDRNYCFRKNQISYSCRLCKYTGTDIVLHYRNQHPHIVIPLSRMPPEVAKEAIEQCQEINFQAISNIPSDKYICTFCYKEFTNTKSVLETFFWHIVSTHTGEYKQHCSQCDNVNKCPFNLDIPSPPKDAKGQLIGFICKKCNFTQISLENLKTHIILHHNDEQTAVYRINLSIMTKKSINVLLRRSAPEQASLQTSTRRSLDHSVSDLSENTDRDDNEGVKTRTSARKAKIPIVPPIQSKITFEGDDNISDVSDVVSESGEGSIKMERTDSENADAMSNNEECVATDISETDRVSDAEDQLPLADLLPSSDVMNYPHFKINLTETGAKEYVCCINGNYHFKTTLLISMKKHVKSKHSEPWEGYCFVCKVIVTPQGVHRFSDCLQHYLDKHMDNFPIFEEELPAVTPESAAENTSATKPYINVRPLSELITRTADSDSQKEAVTPVIQSVMSLGTPTIESPQPSPTYAARLQEKQMEPKVLKYEEHQAEVLSKKYYLVVQDMMVPDKLVKVFKCAGIYCKYATDSTEEALAHATTHQRIGGADALNCCYCDFDSAGNAVDLVMHVFKSHGNCRYCCEHCFYRAASSQAVGAHSSKVHGKSPVPGSVLRTATVSSLPLAKVNILTRQEAVSYYICGHSEHGEPCKFRTYTPDKFCEHLLQRHATATEHPCNLCPVQISTATELVQHMKVHGLKLYQCTWCVHGADNESEMLTHVSSLHPDKQPQAYIRIITNKDGSNALRVLPLAFLTKHKVPVKDVIPSTVKDHPVREAERSTEMEALIGPFMADPMEPPVTSPTDPLVDTTETPIQTSEIPEELIEPPEDVKPVVNIQPPELTTEVPQLVQTPDLTPTVTIPPPTVSPQTPSVSNPSPFALPSVKKEPSETIFTDIVVLDSDEEEIPNAEVPSVIDVSDDEASTSLRKNTSKIIPKPNLFTCPQCKQNYKNLGGFKKHLVCCVTDPNRTFQCPHCTFVAENLDKMTWHYVADHTRNSTFECGVCGALLVSENFSRKHMRSCHKQTNIVFTRKAEVGTPHFIVTPKELPPKEKILPKRKLSGSKTDPIPAKRRFEPQEIDQLPITPILDQLVYCSRCEFSTKVRLNMVRHLQLHAEQQPVPQTAPVNPVPHLESNEKHFDKMVNLASSSVVNRTPDKPRHEHTPSVTLLIPPEAAARYPKYVSERQRHTCGAKGCSYISVDEAMLRRHWEALHSGSSDFHCVHCPPHQHLDTSKPLTALRIVSHLKMHDSTLYACSSCSYYHFKREAAEKHVADSHENARVLVVREEHTAPVSPAPVQSTSAPTMDLKPWQCGLCKFKSMLRPEVVDHCSKFHQSKMQFRCLYCPFRTSTIENVSKHQSNSHAGKPEEIFYYYYRVGSIPDENDGTPLWVKQRQKLLAAHDPAPELEVKVETPVSPAVKTVPPVVVPAPPLTVDLNLVKKEVNEAAAPGPSSAMEDLCNQFGQFSEPNGIKYKCPLCAVVMEETRELMQSHLYEELNYRKWSCGLCSYKAFHKAGLTDHMTSEHRRQYDHIELPTNTNIERWVTGVLDHQTTIIDKRKENFQKQRIVYIKPTESAVSKETASKYPEKDLEQAFGTFGLPDDAMFKCPKCTFMSNNETAFRDHLEMELNKIRWCCTICPENFQTHHESRLHSKAHDGPSWPKEAIRDPAMRATWVSTAIEKQKKIIQNPPSSLPHTPDNPEAAIDKRGENLQRQKSSNDTPGPSTESVVTKETASIYPEKDLEQAFGAFGLAKGVMFSCPKCDYLSKTETAFRDHLEMELNKIRWCCTHCPQNFQTYHEARFHGKGHEGPSWPKEAIRDPAMRATWVSTTIEKQRKVIQNTPTASSLPPTPEKFVPDSDNSLLVVRYERKVPTPDQVNVRRKRPISDSDEEKLVIDEPAKKKEKHCPHCDYKSLYTSSVKVHMLTHFGLKPYTCFYCSFDSYTKKAVAKHIEQTHIDKPVRVKVTELPQEAKKQDDITLTCLVCEKPVREADINTHLHNNVKPEFSQSLIVHKCGICSTLCRDSASLTEHQQKTHPGEPIQYSLYTLGTDTFICLYCDSKFQFLKDYRAHHMAAHPALRFTVPSSAMATGSKSSGVNPVVKRCARKSTTKLPNSVAKKSTTKLPYSVPDDSSDDEYSYYGTRPPPLDEYSNVTTLMSFCNRMMPFSLKQLSEHLNIEPKVLVTDVKNSSDLKFNL